MMTKTDYEVTANAIASTPMEEKTRLHLVALLSRTYKSRNPKFNPNKFSRLANAKDS